MGLRLEIITLAVIGAFIALFAYTSLTGVHEWGGADDQPEGIGVRPVIEQAVHPALLLLFLFLFAPLKLLPFLPSPGPGSIPESNR